MDENRPRGCCGPVRSGTASTSGRCGGCGADPGIMQDRPHGGGGDRVAEFDEFALHPPVPPRRVVGGDADHELADRGCRRRPGRDGVGWTGPICV